MADRYGSSSGASFTRIAFDMDVRPYYEVIKGSAHLSFRVCKNWRFGIRCCLL